MSGQRAKKRPPNSSASVNRRVIFIDAETDPFSLERATTNTFPVPFVWGAWDGATFQYWRDTRKFVSWLALQDAVVYAHNGGRFDFHFLLPWFNNGQIKIINGRIACARIGRAELRDSWLCIPGPLRTYKKDTVNYAHFEADVREQYIASEILPYLTSDCRYGHELISAFRANHGDALTIAGAALRDLGTRCALELPRTTAAYHATITPWYRGGRVHARIGRYNGPIHAYDINSAYPAAMATGPLPWGATYTQSDRLPADPSPCLLRLRGECNGFFPILDRFGATLYPTELAEVQTTGFEYLVALKHGWRGDILSVLIPAQTTTFEPFVDYWFAEKKRWPKTSPQYCVAKYTLNSAYGKLGCDPAEWLRYLLLDNVSAEPHGYDHQGQLGDRQLYARALTDTEIRYYDVGVAASITGAVRATWLDTALNVGIDNVIYGDTDALFLGPLADAAKINVGPALGQWSLEGTFKHASIAAKKIYVLYNDCGLRCKTCEKRDCKIACKGAQLSGKEIDGLLDGKEVHHQQIAPTFSIKRGKCYTARTITKG